MTLPISLIKESSVTTALLEPILALTKDNTEAEDYEMDEHFFQYYSNDGKINPLIKVSLNSIVVQPQLSYIIYQLSIKGRK